MKKICILEATFVVTKQWKCCFPLFSKPDCVESMRLCCFTLSLHRVGLVVRDGLHHLLHHITIPMGGCQGHQEEEDARNSYVHLPRLNLQDGQGDGQCNHTQSMKCQQALTSLTRHHICSMAKSPCCTDTI